MLHLLNYIFLDFETRKVSVTCRFKKYFIHNNNKVTTLLSDVYILNPIYSIALKWCFKIVIVKLMFHKNNLLMLISQYLIKWFHLPREGRDFVPFWSAVNTSLWLLFNFLFEISLGLLLIVSSRSSLPVSGFKICTEEFLRPVIKYVFIPKQGKTY